jgi:hypothetical protein
LAEHGSARAFLSFLPQAPLPSTIVGIRLESAGARAGGDVRFVGFVRRRVGDTYRRAGGQARIVLVGRGKTVAETSARLDAAGAFAGTLHIPDGADSGDYAVLSEIAEGGRPAVGGASLHVDAGRFVALAVHANCPCSSSDPVIVKVLAREAQGGVADLPISVRVVRAPHVLPPGAAEGAAQWGTALVYEKTVRTDENGVARVELPPPGDGLASTYGVSARASGATATARVTVPVSSTALAIEPDAERIGAGEAAAFSVRGFDATDGEPAANLHVLVRLMHGPSSWEKDVLLDERGRGRVVFPSPGLGTDLALAKARGADGRATLDATSVSVDPSNREAGAAERDSSWSVSLDRSRYRAGEVIAASVSLPGASGDALVTLEGERVYQMRVVKIQDGRASATLRLPNALGDVRVSAAAVRGGAIVLGTVPVTIDAPGHAREMRIQLDRTTFSPGDQVRIAMRDAGGANATVLVRIADGRESGQAYFDDAPELLRIGGTTTQNPASSSPAWHAFVAPSASKAADVYAAERPRTQAAQNFALGAEEPRTLLWRTEHDQDGKISVPLPVERGRYVLSILRIDEDGSVGASSTSLNVQ